MASVGGGHCGIESKYLGLFVFLLGRGGGIVDCNDVGPFVLSLLTASHFRRVKGRWNGGEARG